MQARRILGGEQKKFSELKSFFSGFELCNVWNVIGLGIKDEENKY
jgi:hypothetical protein